MKVNEIFYSIQGEGRYTGTPAVFVRLSGCNLRCWFCDTRHEEGKEMAEEEILEAIKHYPARFVVLTGGEPTLQLTARLTQLLHDAGYFIQIETNGTMPLAEGVEIDWVTCSPKGSGKACQTKDTNAARTAVAHIRIQHIDELKVVYEESGQDLSAYETVPAKDFRLQPCDTGDKQRNAVIREAAMQYILEHPQWHLSVQLHKILDVR